MSNLPITIDRERIAEVCRRHKVQRLCLFGSVLRSTFNASSDVDILVEFLPGARISFLDLASLEADLAAVIGRTVDLRTTRELSKYFRDQVVAEALEQYAA
ncbi:MAG: nucleotidyltransferase domain-containing protein [Phycisphaerales bacterium]|nr:nucleotidyltransferase domain-containing protein [Phycisphaerales bacterium]